MIEYMTRWSCHYLHTHYIYNYHFIMYIICHIQRYNKCCNAGWITKRVVRKCSSTASVCCLLKLRQVRDIRCVLEGHPPLVLEARSGIFSWKEDFFRKIRKNVCYCSFVMAWNVFFCQKIRIDFFYDLFFLCFLFKCWVWFLLIFTQQKWKKDKYEAITGHSCWVDTGEWKMCDSTWRDEVVATQLIFSGGSEVSLCHVHSLSW